MTKKWMIPILSLIFVLFLASQLLVYVNVSAISTEPTANIIRYSNATDGSDLKKHLQPEFVEQVLKVLTNRVYQKQPLIKIWSRDYIRYEVSVETEGPLLHSKYLILINPNERSTDRPAFLSRVNVEQTSKSFPFLNQSYSIRMNQDQVQSLMNLLKVFKYESLTTSK